MAGSGAVPGMREDSYHDTVLRDLEWLFNGSSPLSEADAEMRRRYPRASSSVLGYGLRGILGRVVNDPGDMEERVKTALAAFEPRLVVEDMSLRLSREGQLVEIEIKGLLLTQQAKRQLWIRTDLETLQSKLRVEANG